MTAILDAVGRVSLSDVGSWASVAGLALTIWVALSVWRIKSFYLFRARVPDLARRLRQHSSALANYLNDVENFGHKVREELVAAEVTANSLRRKLSGAPKRAARTLVGTIQKAHANPVQPAAARAVYLQMIHLNEELKDLLSDLKWER